MIALAYRLLSASPPPVREQLVLAPDGTLMTWRSNGPEVGRFLGRPADARLVESLGRAALDTRPPRPGPVSPDALFEVIEVGDVTLSIGAESDVGGPWGSLVAACREIIGHVGEPLAAVGLLMDGPNRVRLEHRGSEPLRVGLGAVVATAVAYRDGDETVTASTRFEDGVVEAEPGWSLPISLDPVGAGGDGEVLSVTFNLDDDGVWVPVHCEVLAPA